MTALERDVLTILRGDETIYDEEGIYDIWSYSKDGGTVVSIRDAVTEEILYEDLPIAYMVVKAPFVVVQTFNDTEV
jgi:hypothetical protein